MENRNKNLENAVKSLKYIPKIWTALSFPLLLIMAMVLFFGRNFKALRISWIMNLFQDFYSHISNFSISLVIYIIIGYSGLLFGITVKYIIIIGISLVFLNLLVELLIPVLNTPDLTDAVYGIFGVFTGFIFLFIAKKYGLKLNEL